MQGDAKLKALAQASGSAEVAARATGVLRAILAGRAPSENDRAVLRREAEVLDLLHSTIAHTAEVVHAQVLSGDGVATYRSLRNLASHLASRNTLGPLDNVLPQAASELRELADSPSPSALRSAAEHAIKVSREMVMAALNVLGSSRADQVPGALASARS